MVRPIIKQSTAALIVAMVALTTDMLIYGLVVPVLPVIAAEQGASDLAIGVLFGSYAAALLLSTPLIGLWVDRVGSRKPMIAGLAGLAGATLLFAFAPNFPMLLLARILQGIAAAVTWTASLVLIASAFPAEARGRAMGLAFSAVGLGILLGPPLGGFLYEHWGVQVTFLFATAVAGADAVVRWALVRDSYAPSEPETWVDLLRHRRMPLIVVLTALGATLIAFLEPILPLHLATELGATPTVIGLLFGIATLVGTCSAPLAGLLSDRFSWFIVCLSGVFLGVVALGLTGLCATIWQIGLALTLVTVASWFILTPTTILIAEIAEAHQPPSYGASYGLYNLAYALGLTLGPIWGGAASRMYGFQGAALRSSVLLALAGTTIIVVLWAQFHRRGNRK